MIDALADVIELDIFIAIVESHHHQGIGNPVVAIVFDQGRHLKMNQASVRGIRPESGSGSMAKTLIDIGHNLNMLVVAQGVETRTQMEFLKSNGCDAMQGAYFSEPLSLDALKLLLQGQPGH